MNTTENDMAAKKHHEDGNEDTPVLSRTNGLDQSGAHTHSRVGDPTNLYALTWRFVEKFGIIAGFCIAMGAFIWWRESVYERTTSAVHTEFKASLDAQTKAVENMTAAQSATNIELVKIGSALDRHLQHDEERHR